MSSSPVGVSILPAPTPDSASILTFEALEFLAHLHRTFNKTREELLFKRTVRAGNIANNEMPTFLSSTASVRNGTWKVAETPKVLEKRHVEITGPTSPSKMAINALNSGADVWMADFEDALSPLWSRIIDGHVNMKAAVHGTLHFTSPEGKEYKVNPNSKTVPLSVSRVWHLLEKHVWVDGQPISASIFDFGMYFFHNAHTLIAKGLGPYFYLPKMESHLEARLWNAIFSEAQDRLHIPRGTIRATVLIETILAAFEMDEILYELRDHSAGLNAGRWDYIFSIIKKFCNSPKSVLPDRADVTMRTPFMQAYAQLLVKTCHRRGAHAIGGMAAFIPTSDPKVNESAFQKVREDKLLELENGYDGTWVAHPGLVKLVADLFHERLNGKMHQKDQLKEQIHISPGQLIDFTVPGFRVTEAGLRTNIRAAVLYLSSWLSGNGAVAINNLMEDAATAEISRAQIWQWIRNKTRLEDGRVVTKELYMKMRDEEQLMDKQAVELVNNLVLRDDFIDFLTLLGYESLFLTAPSKL
ncbi:malate synthase-like [Schistocerca gregaria]|uniref:malate synthase-like n=1 Tax=Schistocerca gregaria TaxID=7010 RepID=UPI00211F3E7E|nr:malate synthase-like [Schistocerca gregaria]XP_049849261.1 malate synthase-like [Schistocerca gregaria]